MSSPSPHVRVQLIFPCPPSVVFDSSAASPRVEPLARVAAPRSLPFDTLKQKIIKLYQQQLKGDDKHELQVQVNTRVHDVHSLIADELTQVLSTTAGDWVSVRTNDEWSNINPLSKCIMRLYYFNTSTAPSSSSGSSASPAYPPVRIPFSTKPHGRWPVFQPAQLPPVIDRSQNKHASQGSTHYQLDEEVEWIVLDDEDESGEPGLKTRSRLHEVNEKTKNLMLPQELLTKLNINNTENNCISFTLNGVLTTVANPSPSMKLIEYLRYHSGYTGAKIACAEGGCGACTIHITKPATDSAPKIALSTNACLHLLSSCDGWSILTTEGLGSDSTGLHPIQKSLADNDGTQCGYCSPGFVMEMYGLLQETATPTLQQIEDRFDGHICRCTGYRPIFKAMRAVVGHEAATKACANTKHACNSNASASATSTCGSSLKPCGKGTGAGCSSSAKSACHDQGMKCGFKECTDIEDITYDPTSAKHNIPLPQAIIEYKKPNHLTWSSDSTSVWITPTSLSDVYTILNYYVPLQVGIRLVGGNTSVGVIKYYPLVPLADNPTVYVYIKELEELNQSVVTSDGLWMGAAMTINQIIAMLKQTQTTVPAASTANWNAVIAHLGKVANTGVRNMGSWAGNLMMARQHKDFQSDLLTVFAGLGCQVVLSSSSGNRQIPVSQLQDATLGQDEILFSILFPFTPVNSYMNSYKARARHQNCHAIINAAFNFTYTGTVDPTSGMPIISNAVLLYGGLVPYMFVAVKTQNYLSGKVLNPTTLQGAIAMLQTECIATPKPVETVAYRQSLCLTLFFKHFLQQLSQFKFTLPAKDLTAFETYIRPISAGVEVFTPNGQYAPVGNAVHKLEGYNQASGQAVYTDDIPNPVNGLYGAFVFSTIALGTLASIDVTAAMALPGVVRFISAADIATIGASNNCGAFPGDEEIFASTNITTCGQSIGMILADTAQHALDASKAVVVNYNVSTNTPIFNLKDAIAAKSFFPDNQYLQNPPPITCGNVTTGFANSKHVVSGASFTGSQAHFYMETQSCYVQPGEQNSLRVYSSSQGPVDIRAMLLSVLGIQGSKLVVSTKRAGGAFGGKLSRSHPIATATAIASRITGKPVRSQTDRQVDLNMFGKRQQMYIEYKVGFNDDAKIQALQVTFYSQGGHTYESNFGAMSMCLLWADNAYYIPNYSVTGVTCRTNTPSNTAMRGPGAMKSIWHMENIIEHIANVLQLAPDYVRTQNFYAEGQLTPYQQPVTNITIQRIWAALQTQSNYAQVVKDVAAYNATSRWRKRGVHMTAVKYGITDPGNQCAVNLNVMVDDGSVIVSHSGVEIGQGINTKVAQAVAYGLGIDISLVTVAGNATDVIPNGSQTGGSSTSESCVAAALLACTNLTNVLQPFVKANPGKTWAQIIPLAWAGGANLSQSAVYNLPGPAMPFTYFVWAAACSQVEVDILTGEVQVAQVDIVYDNGDSLNPSIDIGQIEGGFVMGLGHFLSEEVLHDMTSGVLLTTGTWNYHPPLSQDIPIKFNVTLLDKSPNAASGAILSSKATGEPPLMLSASVFYAIKDCIAAARADAGNTDWFDLDTPATCQRIQQLCMITPSELVV